MDGEHLLLALLGQGDSLVPELSHVPALSKPVCRVAGHFL
jgi:hypothetical protein